MNYSINVTGRKWVSMYNIKKCFNFIFNSSLKTIQYFQHLPLKIKSLKNIKEKYEGIFVWQNYTGKSLTSLFAFLFFWTHLVVIPIRILDIILYQGSTSDVDRHSGTISSLHPLKKFLNIHIYILIQTPDKMYLEMIN